MSKLFLFITLFLIAVLVIAGNVNAHQYPAKPPMLPFPYTKNHNELNIDRSVEIQIPKVNVVDKDKTLPSMMVNPNMRHGKLREYELSRKVSRHNFRTIICTWSGKVNLEEAPPLPPIPISIFLFSPIANPLNDKYFEPMSIEEFYEWKRNNWVDYVNLNPLRF